MAEDKSHRGAASQFFVAGELCRRGLVAVVTLGNCPNTDILVSDKSGTKFCHVQVKTYRPGRDKTVSVGVKAETNYEGQFFWILAGIPEADSKSSFEYFILPSHVISKLVIENHKLWLSAPGKHGHVRKDSKVRAVSIPPARSKYTDESIELYRNRWDLIEAVCGTGDQK